MNISPYHLKSVYTAVRYIDAHLDDDLSLNRIAKIAHYSPFHFHRLFREVMSEPLSEYVSRKRTERTAAILIRRKEVSLTEIYLKFGFASHSSLTRTFKKHYGLSPTQFRQKSPGKYSKISQLKSKIGQVENIFETDICSVDNRVKRIEMKAEILVKEISDIRIAYVNQIGSQGLGAALGRIMHWARPKGLLDADDFKLITVYHDSFKITPAEKVRMSAGIILEEDIKPSNGVEIMSLPSGKCIVARLEIGVHEFSDSWSSLFVWMNEQGYKKSENDPFEIYHNDFNTHPQKKCIVDFYIPIESS